MADRPFGFGLPDKPEDQGGQGSSGSGGPADPGAGGPMGSQGPFGAMGDPQQFADALRQFADMLSYRGGPVNWDLAKNVARHAIVAAGDPSVLEAQRREITEAVRLADLWLDEAAAFPSGIRKIEAWSRSEWLEATFPVWAKLCDPIAAKGVEAMSGMFTADPAQLGEEVPEELRQALGALGGAGGHDASAGRGNDRQPDRDGRRRAGPRGDRLRRHRAAAGPGGHGRAAARGRGRVQPEDNRRH